MKLRNIILLLFCFILSTLSAQTLEQARAMFSKGEYEKAKPVFQRFVKSQPANANYNYWYGVCCLQTGEAEKSISYLEFARKKRIQNAPLHLGKAYDQTYRFDAAVEAFQVYITEREKKKQSVDEASALLEKSKHHARMLKGVEEVCVIDSFVTDKQNFLDTYKISGESGKIYTYNDFFKTSATHEGIVYVTELKNKIYYGERGEDDVMRILTKNKLLDDWSKGVALPENINSGANANYPFVLTDGITIYYAAEGENSMGGYDIFVTRFNTGTESYLAPENVGMPFNSPYNDYMYVIDEYNNLGWFATDRYQPEDKVCIYVFIPNSSKLTYNYEAMEPEKIRNLARLSSIEDTWKDEDIVEDARDRLESVINETPEETQSYDFEFVINDKNVYHSLSDFRSPIALQSFRAYQQMQNDYNKQLGRLNDMRERYATLSADEQQRTAPAIQDLEKRVRQMAQEISLQEVKVRNEEIQTIKK